MALTLEIFCCARAVRFRRFTLQLDLAPGCFGLLHLHLVGLAPRDVPEVLGGLDDGQWKLLGLAVRQAAATAVQALAERGEPALEHGA
jgi:hypothetical protein